MGQPTSKVRLLRPLWGHPIGTMGRLRNGFLLLKGSPPARVYPKDLDRLFRIVKPPEKMRPR